MLFSFKKFLMIFFIELSNLSIDFTKSFNIQFLWLSRKDKTIIRRKIKKIRILKNHFLPFSFCISNLLFLSSNSFFCISNLIFILSNSFFCIPNLLFISSNSFFSSSNLLFFSFNSFFSLSNFLFFSSNSFFASSKFLIFSLSFSFFLFSSSNNYFIFSWKWEKLDIKRFCKIYW